MIIHAGVGNEFSHARAWFREIETENAMIKAREYLQFSRECIRWAGEAQPSGATDRIP